MHRFTWVLLLLAGGTTGPAAENVVKVEPALELRVRAAADMIDVFDYLLKLAPNDPQWQQYLKMAKLFGESKNGFLGLDPKKPVGAYVGIAAEVSDSPVVLMVPIAVEADFLATLKTYLKLDPKKVEGGLYSFAIPKIPAGPGYFRFSHGYAYFTVRSEKSIAPDRILQPKDFFAEKHPDILNAKVRIDAFPVDIRKAILGQMELGWHENLAASNGCPFCQAARRMIVDWAGGTLKTLLNDGKTLDFSLRIDPKTDVIAASMVLTPRPGSGLAKYLTDAGRGESYTIEMKSDGKTMLRSVSRR